MKVLSHRRSRRHSIEDWVGRIRRSQDATFDICDSSCVSDNYGVKFCGLLVAGEMDLTYAKECWVSG